MYTQPRADKLETFAGKWVPIRVSEWSDPSSAGQKSMDPMSFDARGVMSWSDGGGRGTATMHFDSPVAYVHCSGGYTNTWCSDPSGNGLTDRIDVFPDGTIWMEAGSEFWAKEGSPAAIELHDEDKEPFVPFLCYGARIKMRHVETGCRLHSHPHYYPEGSNQQQVTCFEGSDDNDWWLIKAEHDGEAKSGTVNDGAIIRLEHCETNRNLHSHEISSAVTGQGEVSCYGHGDANDNWRVDYDEGPNDAFRLQHVNTAGGGDGHYLHSHGLKYPDWGFDQQEVTNYAGKDDNDLWVVCEKKAAEFEFKGKFVAGYGKFVAGFECGKYRIKTAGHGPGEQPAGWGLAAWQEHGGKRNDSSSRVAVHEGDHWPCDWEIKPGTQPGTYRIETCGHEEGGQPAGWGLAAWNNIEKRNDSSSWVYVHEGDEWPCDWEIKPGTQEGTYRIYCCGHDAGGQPAGWGLAAWNAHGAERNGSSSWIAVHDGDHWPCDWFLERVG